MLLPYEGHMPLVASSAFVDPSAEVAGRVTVGDEASLWYFVAARGDHEPIAIGPRTNVQDGSVLHVDPGYPLVVGADVTVGHGVVLHGCTVGDGALVGIRAVVLSGARVGAGTLVAAGALVPEGAEVPPGMLAMGMPARVRRGVSDAERERMRLGAQRYVDLARAYGAARRAALR
jgi:carbonic anhydrase/acetyltransferase-like protein (isoleucine patch superfamily)